MILEQVYREIMEHVAVTEQMRQRILRHIQQAEYPEKSNRVSLLSLRRWLAAAACVAVFLLSTIAITDVLHAPPVVQKPGINNLWEISEVYSAQELSEIVGFSVDTLSTLPFPVQEIRYTAFGTQLAEIKYIGESQSAVYRKAVEVDDPSGDYTEYDVVLEKTVGGCPVTLKGTEDGLYLAVWHDDSYSYSIRLSCAISETAWVNILKQVC